MATVAVDDPAVVTQRDVFDTHPALMRFAVRFGIIYSALVALMSSAIFGLRDSMFFAPIGWVETPFAHLLGLGAYPLQSGLIVRVLVASVGAWLWTRIDKKPRDERILFRVFQFELRFILGTALVASGLGKLLAVTTPIPSPADWIRPIREMDPQHYLTVWVGSSVLHKSALGSAELLAGLLLLFRRTTTFGAFLAFGVMGNAIVTNIAFGDPRVGYYWPAVELVAMAIVLLLADGKRLLTTLFFPLRSVPPVPKPDPWPRGWMRSAAPIAKWMAVALFLSANVPIVVQGIDARKRSLIRGVFRVDRYTINGLDSLSDYESRNRWRLVAMDDCNRFAVRTIDDRQLEAGIAISNDRRLIHNQRCATQMSLPSGTLRLVPSRNLPRSSESLNVPATLQYNWLGREELELDGMVGGARITAHLVRVPDSAFRVFRWLEFGA
jgi:uncharacterized membrane protein YphA (DoxX/SURF4 family)